MKQPPTFQCPIPLQRYPQIVAAHGGGGQLMHNLIREMLAPVLHNPHLQTETDAATLPAPKGRLAMTTDSYVVQPIQFPGGDIGKLAVCGTVNDLATSGARPLYLSLGLILEEGLSLETLHEILHSIAQTAKEAGVSIVTGDTKVISTPGSHGLLINTTGVGVLPSALELSPGQIQIDDVVLVSGDIGRHGLAIMMKREGLEFESTLESDVALLHEPIQQLLQAGINLRAIRDLTRGGLATALLELAEAAGKTILLQENEVPVSEQVEAACELLGLDPLYAACEGRFAVLLPREQAPQALEILQKNPACPSPRVIGSVLAHKQTPLLLQTRYGLQRILHRQSGEQMPRIC